MNDAPVICGIATMDGRQECLIDTLESLSPQCDEIWVYPNDYNPIDVVMRTAEKKLPNIRVYLNTDRVDMGDTAMMKYFFKYYRSDPKDQLKANFMTAGDDLIYPPDYVESLVAAINRYGRRAAVGFHGRIYFAPVESYYRSLTPETEVGRARAFPCLRDCFEDEQRVTLLSTCAIMWPSELFSLSPDDFPIKNMTDIWISKKLNDLGIPRIIIPHEGGWIVHTDKFDIKSDTICAKAWWDDEVQTEVFNSTDWRL